MKRHFKSDKQQQTSISQFIPRPHRTTSSLSKHHSHNSGKLNQTQQYHNEPNNDLTFTESEV